MKTNKEFKILNCDASGFSHNANGVPKEVKWLDIESLTAYKADLLTFDEIRLDIIYGTTQLTITEETQGWKEFLSKTKCIFPSIPTDWDLKIVQPPFSTNLSILYENTHQKIFVDFMNADTFGRIRLNTVGSLKDIEMLGSNFKENIYVLLDDDDENLVFGCVKYSVEEQLWVAEINEAGFIQK